MDKLLKKIKRYFRALPRRLRDWFVSLFRPTKAQKSRRHRRWKRLGTICAMVLGDGILILMITAGKIDTLCGVLFVAALSALCGNKAR